jgi:protein-disulfide isomerase
MIERLLRSPLALAGAFVLCALLGAGIFAAIQAALPVRKAEAERVVHDYIVAHPDVLLDSVDAYHQKQQAAAAAQALAVVGPRVHTPFAGAWAGNPQGDVTVVAFMDYACGYCRASLPALTELLQRDPKVRVVYREIPVLGPDSVVAARWALAAAEQGKFRPFHDALFASDGPSTANIAKAAAAAGLDTAQAQTALKSKPVEDELASNREIAGQIAMSGTPTWVVGNQVLYGARDYASLAAAVAEARKPK